MELIEKFIPINPFSRPGTKRSVTRNIVWHYTGNPGATALGHYGYFGQVLPKQDPFDAKKDIYASAHIFIDRINKVALIPLDEEAYHASQANPYSIGVELCIESDWTFHPDTIKNAIEVGKWLNEKYGLKTSDYLRHYDVTGKDCPRPWVTLGQPSHPEWEKFKKAVDGKGMARVPNWTEDQWIHFTKGLEGLYFASVDGVLGDNWVISDYAWVEKAYKKELTVDEVLWLQSIMFMRSQGVDPYAG